MSLHDTEKARAKKLSSILKAKGIEVPHMAALDVISKMEGFRNWNTYQAYIDSKSHLLPIPEGWALGGDRRDHYDAGRDATELFDGKPTIVLRHKPNKVEKSEGFATITQKILADNYRNKTVQFSAFLKTENCDGATTIWLRADDSSKMPVAFDNLETSEDQPPLTGNSNWIKREIRLAIPASANQLAFGYYLRGHGAAYVAQFSLTTIETDHQSTNQITPLQDQPVNLSLE